MPVFDPSLLAHGFLAALTWQNLLVMALSTAIGIIAGALPGVTATMAMALLVPLTFGMSPEASLLLLSGVYCGAIYGGGITAILLNIPGTPASLPTAWAGYPMAQRGESARALGGATYGAAMGGLASAALLLVATPPLSELALRFGPPELFSMALLGLSVTSSMVGDRPLNGFIVATLGLLLGTIGLDPIGGFPRFTFGIAQLMGGVDLVPLLIGVFAIPQVLDLASGSEPLAIQAGKIKGSLLLRWAEVKGLWRTVLKSSLIGMVIGIVPAAGPETATFLAYNEARRVSSRRAGSGMRELEGVVASECAGNASTGGDVVPTLTLGVPGSAAAAVYLGALYIHGLRPGPSLMQQQGPAMYTLFAGFFIINVILFFLGLSFCRLATHVLRVPSSVLAPLVLALSVVGSYASNTSMSGVWVMLVGGLIAYLLQGFGFSPVPVLIALIMGPMAESSFSRSLLLSYGNPLIFITRPISLVLLLLAVVSGAYPYLQKRRARRQEARAPLTIDTTRERAFDSGPPRL